MGLINGVKTAFSDLKESVSRVINTVKAVFSDVIKDINQVDCPDEENLVINPELQKTLQSVANKEKNYLQSLKSTNSKKQQIVETVTFDLGPVNAMANETQEQQLKVVEKDGEERE